MEENGYRRRWGFREGRIRQVMNELDEHNEVKCGEAFLVRIPKIEGKIVIREIDDHTRYVEYICESWYDSEKKQMRNRKARIGQCFEAFPGAMLPNEKYYELFDRRTGELKERDAQIGQGDGSYVWQEPDTRTGPMSDSGPGANEEEGEDVTRREIIQEALKKEGVIRREEEQDERTDKKIKILLDLLASMRDVIKDQARKRPEAVVNLFQAQKINEVLREIREIEEKKGYGELLELIEEPREIEQDGKKVTAGMSYSDAEVLMECYNSVIWFTQGEM